ERLNKLLEEAGFDAFVEERCRKFYAATMGRPSLAPGMYFRLLLIGYFEGLDSERGMAWRAADSLGLRRFLRIGLEEAPPDHSTISRTRRLIEVETHREVFTWVLGVLARKGLLPGKTLGVDATTLEANAALRSIVRRDSGESYQEFLTKLAQESGIATPTRDDLARLDRKRKKKGSNRDWVNPHDPEARITKMKDGRTHLAHKAEHAVDLETGAVVAVTVQGADQGDTTTVKETFIEAAEQVEAVGKEAAADEQMNAQGLEEVVTDKGYHSGAMLEDWREIGVRSYISEPQRGRRHWQGKKGEQAAVYGNRRRIRGERGKQLLRRRGELLERTFAHIYDTGGMRRTHLRGHRNILKRLLLHVAAFNLSLVLRREAGVGTPRGLQGRWNLVLFCVWFVWLVPESVG
ncbi:MAG: transposase, partial [Bryobacteraceae bacterium]